jgi:hypothetical protein
VGEEADDEGGGGLFGVLLVALTLAGHGEEGVAGGGGLGDEGADLGELPRAAAVLEGVEVAAGSAGAGAGAATLAAINPFGSAQGRLRCSQMGRR